ncbi:ComEA family DNA-binding protein [Rhodoferax sp. UBA5149]|uniref:ComEA family DNA-binding protein n=1 Tax=Rhodoferax sp. UBA5149 TaxID=1947379 RepID=UPI0025F07DD1|nr:helix-hairpin-helix domain-containing protein [Rhodoferax sp. UBA5149]
MKLRFFSIVLTTAALLLSANLSLAADAPTDTAKPAVGKAQATKNDAKAKVAAKGKAAAKVKLVDINSASSAELKKLPGITDSEATKIIAGRPYGSKAWLVSHKVLTEDIYAAISQLIVAKQPNKDAAKNAALYRQKK